MGWEVWLTRVFNQENANESIIGCNHSLTATVVLATISLWKKYTSKSHCWQAVQRKGGHKMQWQTKLQGNNKFRRKYFFPFALCCNTRINIYFFRKPTSKDSINCKYSIFEDKYTCSYEWSYWSAIRGAMWGSSSSPSHKVRKGGQSQPSTHLHFYLCR